MLVFIFYHQWKDIFLKFTLIDIIQPQPVLEVPTRTRSNMFSLLLLCQSMCDAISLSRSRTYSHFLSHHDSVAMSSSLFPWKTLCFFYHTYFLMCNFTNKTLNYLHIIFCDKTSILFPLTLLVLTPTLSTKCVLT